MHRRNHFHLLLLVALLAPHLISAQETLSDSVAQDIPTDTQVSKPLNRIIAVVNEDVITEKELTDAIKTATKRLQSQGVHIPDDPKPLHNQVLETIITKRIQLQHAKETGLDINDNELDETINRIADENKMSLPEFSRVLEKDGIGIEKFRQEIRDEMIISRLRDRETKAQVNVTDGEVENFLRTQDTSSIGSDEYRLGHILIAMSENMNSAQIQQRKERADLAYEKLKEGVDFSRVASEFSDAADAAQGGIVDWRPASQLGPQFVELLGTLQPGDLTQIIQSPAGFHIFKLVDRRTQEVPTVIIDQTQARHILIKINELNSDADAKLKIVKLKERLDKGENFEELAKLYSEDASNNSGGSLGWLSPGDTVPAFEQAMNALAPGQISEPVKSQFGWHLIQVIERRTQDISIERRKQAARQAIRARKSDVVIQEWITQLRDQAYIELRLEDDD
ncbi:peptidylprolyl isomerase [Nitrosomonas sp. PY1]|uniref:peptidylprolyl isomerase n=1 Tax=Nitrosomonas sp. PY1 TaxID=1803906 RepID=UPI001FC8E4FC|nr:peptidylprolyl isomerase [Nitrosomonas sp. PY1]